MVPTTYCAVHIAVARYIANIGGARGWWRVSNFSARAGADARDSVWKDNTDLLQRAEEFNTSSDLVKSPGMFCANSDACITFCIFSRALAIPMVAQTQVFVGIQSAAFG